MYLIHTLDENQLFKILKEKYLKSCNILTYFGIPYFLIKLLNFVSII
jgi:hypothetical protein